MEQRMKRERSAGVVVYMENPRRYLILLKQKTTDFPRGKLDSGETEQQAALRETREETGLVDIDILPGFRQVSRFVFGPVENRTFKTITYFLGKTTQESVVVSKEHKGYLWLTPDKAMARVRFKNQRKILERAEKFLASAEQSPAS